MKSKIRRSKIQNEEIQNPKSAIPNPKSKIDLVQDRIKYLRENTDFVSTIFESLIGYAIIAADFDGNIIAYNEGARQIYGYTSEEVIGKQNIDIFFPKDFIEAGGLQQIIDDLIGKGGGSYEGEKVRRGDERFAAQILCTVTRDRNGKVIGFVEIVEDLTERKLAEKALLEAKNYTESIIKNFLDTLIVVDREAKIQTVNPETCRLLGYTEEELIGQPVSMIFAEEEEEEAKRMFQFFREPEKSKTLGPLDTIRNREFTYKTKDRQLIPMSFNASMLTDEAGNVTGVVAGAKDITKLKLAEQKLQKLISELKEAQAQVIQTEKTSTIGTMTAGIAHELNNPMMGILNFVQYCLKHTSEDDRRYAVLQDAERETKRCSGIVSNLLTFSRMEQEGDEEYRKVSCTMILDRVLQLLSYRVVKENVLVTQHAAKGTPTIWMKENNIQQVIFNLINNALDSVKTSEKKEIHVDIHPEGKFLQLTTADTGCGISTENLEKIFDPFFTTKPVGEGTGLGLSICHSIVESHGGNIVCESEIGKGTKITVLLPIEKRQEGKK